MGDAATEVGAKHEIVVGLGLYDVADADQFWALRKFAHLIGELSGAEVDPADDAADEIVLRGEREEPAGFFERLPGLHGDAAVESGLREQRLEIVRKDVATERGHGVVDPAVLDRVVVPEVLMSIDPLHVFGSPVAADLG